MTKPKVNLDLLKKLVDSLEKIVSEAENLRENNVQDYIIEMSKATGLATSTMLEATALVSDIQNAIASTQSPASSAKSDPLVKLLAGIKGGPNKN